MAVVVWVIIGLKAVTEYGVGSVAVMTVVEVTVVKILQSTC